MKLQYPNYEILFAVQDEKDECLPVVRMLMSKYPQVTSRIILGELASNSNADIQDPRDVGVNPKVNNLIGSFEKATHDLLWVVDATVSFSPGALGRVVDAFIGNRADPESRMSVSDSERPTPIRGEVGLVHLVPFAVVYQKTWGSLIEQAFLNTTHAKMYLAINRLAIDSCVIGKANMYSRSDVNSISTPAPSLKCLSDPPRGLSGFAPFLAEDNMIALSLWHELGLRHAMTADVALDFLGALSIWDYVQRRVRWIRVRKRMTPILVVMLEPFTESLLCGICGSWSLHRLFGWSRLAIFSLHTAIWFIVDLQVCHALQRNVNGTRLSFLAWFMREVMTLPIWIYGICGSEVSWRGRRYRVLASGGTFIRSWPLALI